MIEFLKDPRHSYRVAQESLICVDKIEDTLTHLSVSTTDRCNRKCKICPHGNGFVSTQEDMSINTAIALANGLADMNFKGRIGLAGDGEPLLNKHLLEIVSAISSRIPNKVAFELITNGDFLTSGLIEDFIKAGITKILVSLYDGEHQIKIFTNMFAEVNVDAYVLRNLWDTRDLIISNRCGASYKKRGGVITRPCFMPFYKLSASPSGNVGVCDQDWSRKSPIGNVNNEKLLDIWMSDTFTAYRKRLIKGDRTAAPCNRCDALGTLYGRRSFDLFKELYKKEPINEEIYERVTNK